MKIELAGNSGFCFGVKNAVMRVVDEINQSGEQILVYGPLIHNPQTVEILEKRGLKTITDLDDIDGKQVAVRTHGIPIEETRIIKARSSRMINLTCPRVARVQAIIKKYSASGCHTIILGDAEHAEVVGLKSFASSGVSVIASTEETEKIPAAEKYLLVSQTTMNRELFENIVSILSAKFKNLTVVDTICDSTGNRQADVLEGIKKGIDTLIVAGGKNSANTTRLADIGREHGIKTFHIETEKDLSFDLLKDSKYVLVTAGASTPGWIINNILEKLYYIKYKKGNRFFKGIKMLMEFLVRTSSLSAVFAFFTSLFLQKTAGAEEDFYLPVISMLYIFSMYTTNNYFDRKFLSDSNSRKYRIYEKYGKLLTVLSICFLTASFYLIRNYSPLAVFLLVCSSLCGFLYFTLPVKKMVNALNSRFIKKFYSSKIITSLGWLTVAVFVPSLQFKPDASVVVFISLLLLSIITVRHLLIGTVAYQGDFIFGRLSLPIWLGVKGTKILCDVLTAMVLVSCSVSVFLTGNCRMLLLLIPEIYYLILLHKALSVEYPISLTYEILTDLNFVIAILCFTGAM